MLQHVQTRRKRSCTPGGFGGNFRVGQQGQQWANRVNSPWPEGILQPLHRSYHPPTSRSRAKLPCQQWCTLDKNLEPYGGTSGTDLAVNRLRYLNCRFKKCCYHVSTLYQRQFLRLPQNQFYLRTFTRISFQVKILISTNVLFATLSKMFVQDIQQSLGFHRIAIDGIFNPESCIHHGPTLKGTPPWERVEMSCFWIRHYPFLTAMSTTRDLRNFTCFFYLSVKRTCSSTTIPLKEMMYLMEAHLAEDWTKKTPVAGVAGTKIVIKLFAESEVLHWSIVVEMSKASTNKWCAAHLPHQPVLTLCTGRIFLGEELPILVEFVAQI